ncbi:hypothetical protein ACFLVF_02785 [Chloroflexota bacterium]
MSSSENDLSKGEKQILLDIGLNKTLHKSITSHKKAITNPYITLSINSLISRGYLQKDRTKNYQLTSLGRKVYVEIISKYDLGELEALPDVWLREAVMATEAKENLRKLYNELPNK